MDAGQALSGAAYACVALACFLIAGSAVWANQRFAGFERLPRQFGATLKPRAYAPRWVMVWLMPALLVGVLCFIAALFAFLPPEHVNGDPSLGLILASSGLVGAQGFSLWLLTRWANGQD